MIKMRSQRKITKLLWFMPLFILSSFLFAQETHNLEIIWTIPQNRDLRSFGYNLASGDVDNDGRPDIIVSADTFDESGGTTPYRGRIYLYYGNGIGDTIPDVVFKSPFVKGSTPTRVYSADINGDNFDDIIIGEEEANEGFGGITIFWGGNPIDTIPDIILMGRPMDGFFGCAIASGDVNGDSYKDLIVGAYATAPMPGGYLMGRVYIYFGGSDFDTIPDIILNGGHENDYEGFGSDIGPCANLNNGGYEDAVIGAWDFGAHQGRLYIYLGGNPMDTIADVAMIGEGPNQQLGWGAVSSLKNADNFDYAMVGTSLWPSGFPSVGRGKIYILFGGNPMDSIPDVCMIGRQDSSGLGNSLSSAGHILQNSSEAIVAGASREPFDYTGASYIWQGEPDLDSTPDAWIRGIMPDQGIGWDVASAGDIDGDGKDEIMVSNYASILLPKRVWVCKYTGPGVEENRLPSTANRIPLKIEPNPAKSQTAIRFSLSAKSKVTLKVYDIKGNLVKLLNTGRNMLESGQYATRWDLRDNNQKKVSTGIYFLKVTLDNGKEIMKEINKIVVAR